MHANVLHAKVPHNLLGQWSTDIVSFEKALEIDCGSQTASKRLKDHAYDALEDPFLEGFHRQLRSEGG